MTGINRINKPGIVVGTSCSIENNVSYNKSMVCQIVVLRLTYGQAENRDVNSLYTVRRKVT